MYLYMIHASATPLPSDGAGTPAQTSEMYWHKQLAEHTGGAGATVYRLQQLSDQKAILTVTVVHARSFPAGSATPGLPRKEVSIALKPLGDDFEHGASHTNFAVTRSKNSGATLYCVPSH